MYFCEAQELTVQLIFCHDFARINKYDRLLVDAPSDWWRIL